MFSGVGGIDLAAEWAGFETIAQVEIDPWRSRALEKRFPGVRRWSDIHAFPGEWDPGAITLISGGFPCPPYSQAGKRLGKDDPRHFWPEMARVIRELNPAWVVAENVAGAVALVLDDAITDLEEAGYSVWPVVFPALALGAWHERQRLFIVAHLDGSRRASSRDRGKQIGFSRSSTAAESVCSGPQRSVADSDKKHEDAGGYGTGSIFRDRSEAPDISRSEVDADALETGSSGVVERDPEAAARWRTEPCYGGWWEAERGLVRVVHGLSRGLDRHRRRRVSALGDSCAPAQVYPILKAIAEVEMGGEL